MSHDHFGPMGVNFGPNFGKTWPNLGQKFQRVILRVTTCGLYVHGPQIQRTFTMLEKECKVILAYFKACL